MDFTILRNHVDKMRKVYFCHYFLSLPCQIKARSSFITILSVIIHLVFIRSCFLYSSRK
uniref:Uncharacterized protein n=1 Tax=Rhizophora mucronata TaxID=61149 RepID=A0A2P2IIE7_RHIMU